MDPWFVTSELAKACMPSERSPLVTIEPVFVALESSDATTPWERKLVEKLRVGHYQWRTETSYREWARRFCTWLGKKTLKEAGDDDIKRFLTELAVKQRLFVST